MCLLGALPATDAFTAANGTALTTHNANWTLANSGVFQIEGNEVVANQTSAAGVAFWNADTFANEQYSEGITGVMGSGFEIGLCVRISGTNGYFAIWDSANVNLRKLTSGTGSDLISTLALSLSTGDVMLLEAVGTTISLKRNGSVIMTTTDATYASGSAGIMGYGFFGASSPGLASWSAGNVSAAGGSMRRRQPVTFQ